MQSSEPHPTSGRSLRAVWAKRSPEALRSRCILLLTERVTRGPDALPLRESPLVHTRSYILSVRRILYRLAFEG